MASLAMTLSGLPDNQKRRKTDTGLRIARVKVLRCFQKVKHKNK
jgi:hypothetical protein